MATTALEPKDLEIGHFVVLPMGWVDHPFMRNQFVIKNEEQLMILKHLKVSSVDVDLKRSSVKQTKATQDNPQTSKASESAPDPEQIWQQQQRGSLRLAEKNLELEHDTLKQAIAQLAMSPVDSLQDFNNILVPVLDRVYEKEQPFELCAIIKERDSEDAFAHSLTTLHLGIVLAKQLKISREHAKIFGMACLTHGLGMLKVPQNIKRATQELSKSDLKHYRTYPSYSQEMLRKAAVFPNTILPIVANHQELLDGSGFPKGLSQEKISQLTQLLTVIVYFDLWVHPLPSQKSYSSQQTLAKIFKLGGKKFNGGFAQALLQTLGVYPPGSLVQLSDERFALVNKTNPGALMQPLVQILESGKNLSQALFVDLQKDGLKITKSFAKEELPTGLQAKLPAHPRAILQLHTNE